METLKVTTLTLLIAFVWLTSEVAAYPQQIDSVDDYDTLLACGRSSIDHSEPHDLGENLRGLSDTTVRRTAPPSPSSHQTDRNSQNDVCSFDLDLNDTHSLEVAH